MFRHFCLFINVSLFGLDCKLIYCLILFFEFVLIICNVWIRKGNVVIVLKKKPTIQLCRYDMYFFIRIQLVVILNIATYLPRSRSTLREIEDLPWVQQPLEFLQKFGPLVPPTLRVDEHQHWIHFRRRYRFYHKRFLLVLRVFSFFL